MARRYARYAVAAVVIMMFIVIVIFFAMLARGGSRLSFNAAERITDHHDMPIADTLIYDVVVLLVNTARLRFADKFAIDYATLACYAITSLMSDMLLMPIRYIFSLMLY